MKRLSNVAYLSAVSAMAVVLLPTPSIAEAGIKTVLNILNRVNQGVSAARTVNNFVQKHNGNNSNPNRTPGLPYGTGLGTNGLPMYANYGNATPNYGYCPAYAGPRVNALPSVDATTTASANPQANVLPAVDAAATAASVEPMANVDVQRHVLSLTAADIDRMRSELVDRNRALLDRVQRNLDDATGTTISRLSGSTALSSADQTVLLAAVTRGDTEAVRRSLPARQLNSVTGRGVIGLASARQLTSKLLADVNNGGPTVVELSTLLAAVRGSVPQSAEEAIAALASNQQLLSWLNQAIVGANEIPTGDDVPVALVPGLAAGMLIPLGFGPALVGLGQPGDQILIGSGNPWQLAGLALPAGAPLADANDGATARVILSNAGGSVVHYEINQAPFSMESKFEQELIDGSSWVVAFDRGGSNGTARYTLTEGYYEFSPTPTGWELFKKTYHAKLNNQNSFEFNYVADGKQQVIAAGQSVELTGSLPPVIRFENGAGQVKQKRLKGGAFEVAIAGSDNVDIYPASSMATAKATTSNATSTTGDMKLPAGFRPTDLLAGAKASGAPVAESPRSSVKISLFSNSLPAPQATASAR
ncbi:MAG TPA: hypothetical protein VG713_04960 [Pirellulales bacterium]|nr:hypothetical protein [Pirellulales bacterium]